MTRRKNGVEREFSRMSREVMRTPKRLEKAAESEARQLYKHGRMLGPGLIAGAADDDAGGVATYSIVGATVGYALNWLMLLSTPMLIAVQGTCARLGNVTRKGLATLIKERYGNHMALFAAAVLVIANIATITADVAGMSLAMELFTGVKWYFFIIPLCLAILYVIIYRNFNTIQKALIYLSLVLLAYVVTGIVANPNWGEVLRSTFVPHVEFSVTFIAAALGLLGTTITPYLFFWQTATEVEAKRTEKQRGRVDFDIFTGMLYSNIISFFIIISSAVVLYPRLQQLGGPAALNNASDPVRFIAGAFHPLVGNYSFLLFAAGLFAASVLAITVMASSTAYVVSETFGWNRGLNKKVRQARGFYGVIVASVAIAAAILFIGVKPINALYYSQVLSGILDPILLLFIVKLATDPTVMGEHTLGKWYKTIMWATIAVITAFVAILFAGIAGIIPGG